MKKNKKPEQNTAHRTTVIILSTLLAIVIWASISLSEPVNSTLEIPLRLVNAPAGFSTAVLLPERVRIRAKGNGWKFLLLKLQSERVLTVSFPQGSAASSIRLLDAIAENNWLSDDIKILEIAPEEIPIELEKTISRYKKIEPRYDIGFKDGYGLARPVQVQPESVQVFGSKKVLAQIDKLITEKKEFKNIDESFSEEFILAHPNGTSSVPEKIRVYFDVQRLIETRVHNIPVEITNSPPDRKVIFSPGQIAIGISGGIEFIGRVKPEDFKAYIDYKDIVSDSSEYFEPKLILPQFINKLYIEPEKVKAIIKRF
ncbi:MAG: hypothetical protein LWX56_00555 [Ignavibacteria bacterium]|nr:hypothetical protein [Ignavibacteria bacterium]